MTLEDIIFISFSYQNMIYIRQLAPKAQAQYLCGSKTVVDETLIQKLKAYELDVDISYKLLTADTVRLFRENGIKINTWTVDDPAIAEQLAAWGVEYITSNILQ